MAYQALLLRQNTRIVQETIRCCSKEMEYLTWMSPDGLIVLMGKPFQIKHFIFLYSFECEYHFSNIYLLLGLVGSLFHSLFLSLRKKRKKKTKKEIFFFFWCSFNKRKAISAKQSSPIHFPRI